MKPLRLAVDTNVLLDLAAEVDDVLDAVAVIARRLPDTDKLVLPSVLEELTWLLHGFELAPPIIATPREIARKFFH